MLIAIAVAAHPCASRSWARTRIQVAAESAEALRQHECRATSLLEPREVLGGEGIVAIMLGGARGELVTELASKRDDMVVPLGRHWTLVNPCLSANPDFAACAGAARAASQMNSLDALRR